MKRALDLIASTIGIAVLSPIFIFLFFIILILDGWPVFYLQERVGKHSNSFRLLKFRTMKPQSDKKGLLTVGSKDSRITSTGRILRKYKLDELPQLWNVFIGEMSLVGPRPEVKKYVELYNSDQKRVLSVKPGITDRASLLFFNENELLSKSTDPEKHYIEYIMPEKLRINLDYIESNSFIGDLKVIVDTILRIFKTDKSKLK
jgi:lipopolysaccharide/colanic/teichoic acid biosynthesis glycosyltransferase